MHISWYYTEGELTLKVDGDEHSFSLEELIAGSSVFKARRKKVATIFLFAIVFLVVLKKDFPTPFLPSFFIVEVGVFDGDWMVEKLFGEFY